LLSLVGIVIILEGLLGGLKIIFFCCFWAVTPMIGGFNLGGWAVMLGDLMIR